MDLLLPPKLVPQNFIVIDSIKVIIQPWQFLYYFIKVYQYVFSTHFEKKTYVFVGYS